MRTTIRRAIGVPLLFLLVQTACSGHSGQGRAAGIRHDRITQAMILEHGFTNAYEAVQALHTNWLSPRGTDSMGSPTQIIVYYDTTRLGGVETLRTITPTMVEYIQWYNGVEATGRWGLDHGQGVIFVSSQR